MAAPLDISVAEAREIVLGILTSIANLRRHVADIVETIAHDIGSARGRFILELTQNVEDCSFEIASSRDQTRWLSFEVHPERIIVESNQDGFNKQDVVQICRTGRSWKRQQHGFVGEKGIGFKAVFQVASEVRIQSNAFSFYFRYRSDGTVEERLGLVTPLLADDPIPLDERPLTRMTLIPNNTRYENLVAHFDEVHPTLLLFLSKIQEIKITIHMPLRPTTITTFSKEAPSVATPADLTLLIKKVVDEAGVYDTDSEISRYYIFRNSITGLPEDEARQERDGCEVVLAFQVDERDCPLKSSQYDVFAYLPVGNLGFNFLIQADFILQASREEVKSDSAWNKGILSTIADSFCNAVLDFCGRDSPLRYRWVEYLPSGTALQTHHFWRDLPRKIIDKLRNKNILYLHGTSELRKPENVRAIPPEYLDDTGSPIFGDRPDRHRKYLSLEYGRDNINTLKEIFGIGNIEDLAMCHRIKHDLSSAESRIKSGESSNDWHSRAARLIISILGRSQGTGIVGMIHDLDLIPMSDGRWVIAKEPNLYFPAETGPAIPQDILVTIDPESVVNEDRDELFVFLGAKECPPVEVIGRLWEEYSMRGGPANLESSKLHLSYLYWHLEDISDPGLLFLRIYNDTGRRVNTLRSDEPVYLPSEDEYGPHALFREYLPQFAVSFLNSEYLEPISPITRRTRQNDISWLNWLARALRIREVPRLRFPAGSLSTEFRHILQHRPNKIVGTLKIHWATYRPQMTASIYQEIKTADVSCWGVSPTQLQHTYFPAERLMTESARLGMMSRFPFLSRDTLPGYTDSPEDWAFLERFGVQFMPDIAFYLEVLRQHEIGRQKAWNLARTDILNTYSSISDHYSERNKDIIVEAFHRENMILDPSCFQPSSSGPRWIDVDDCVWEGPQDLLDKTPLQYLPEYRTNRKIARLFHGEILEIPNADWSDYIRTLSKLRTNPNPQWDIADRAQKLYRLFSERTISDREWDLIRNAFEDDGLIYVPSANEWYPPSRCLWSSPVPVDGMAVIGADYPQGLTEFFLTSLRISPATLATLVEALRALGERSSSVESVKEMIKAINRKGPERQDLESLTASLVLPIRRHLQHGSITLGNLQEMFAIIDNTKLSAIFRDHVDLLDFSLEEVHELAPFLEGLGLQIKYLSRICTTQTACDEDGMIDESLTRDFTDRAYEILRVAVSHRAPKPPRLLYDRLLASSILKTDTISTTYTLRHTNGELTGPICGTSGHVHFRNHENGWQIFVPMLESHRRVCYRIHFPEALATAIEIPKSCREHISIVLNDSISILEDLLETIGIGTVPDIQPIRRRAIDNIDQREEAEEIQGSADSDRRSIAVADEFFRRSHVSQASVTASEGGSTPRSNISSPRVFFEPEEDDIPNIPIPGLFGSVDAYTQLLGHVIRLARHTRLPQSNFPAAVGHGQHLPGYDHLAAFGVRSLDQMRHDSKIGAAGELFVYEILMRILTPQFGRGNWRSTMRRLVTVHPSYHDMTSWDGRETSDIVYRDTEGNLTRLLIHLGYLNIHWSGSEPEYLIEVKTTTGNCADRFFMSTPQYNMMQSNALQPGRTSAQIYMICRVYDLGKDSMNLKIYVDPETHRQRDALLFTANWTVRPGA